jgi:hypothetical protein
MKIIADSEREIVIIGERGLVMIGELCAKTLRRLKPCERKRCDGAIVSVSSPHTGVFEVLYKLRSGIWAHHVAWHGHRAVLLRWGLELVTPPNEIGDVLIRTRFREDTEWAIYNLASEKVVARIDESLDEEDALTVMNTRLAVSELL